MKALDPGFVKIPLAHRGLHDAQAGRIENSPQAFRAAVSAGYGIELDVQMSADNVAMVFHDDQLDRLTDLTGLVRNRNAAELQAIQLKGSTDTIPTLAEVLRIVDGKVPLLIEIKDQSRKMSDHDIGPLEQAIAKDLRDYQGPVALMSFNPLSVQAFANHAQNICVGLTTGDFHTAEYPNIAQSRLDELQSISAFCPDTHAFISHYALELSLDPVLQIKASGTPVLCWTIRSEQQEQQAREIADNITFEGYPAKAPAS